MTDLVLAALHWASIVLFVTIMVDVLVWQVAGSQTGDGAKPKYVVRPSRLVIWIASVIAAGLLLFFGLGMWTYAGAGIGCALAGANSFRIEREPLSRPSSTPSNL